MNAVSRTRERDCQSLDHRIAGLSADRIEIAVASYPGPTRQSRSTFGGSFAACFLILWVALLLVGRDRMLRDPGTLWHTVAGERMLESRQWITTDPFSFTFEGRPWIAQQWLAECGMGLVHRVAGLDGLLVGAVTILATTFAWLFGRLRRAGLRTPMAVVLLALVVAACSYHFHPRPHLATIALTVWTMGWLTDIEAGRRSSRWLLALPPVMVVWTNLHGGALAGVATTILVLSAWVILSLWQKNRTSMDRPRIPKVLCAVVGIVGGLGVLVNPYGAEMAKVWLALSTSRVLPTIICEHGPVAIGSVEGLALAALAAVYLFILAGCMGRGIRATWFVPLLWLPLAFMRVRHGPLFAVTAAVAIVGMLPFCRWPERLATRGRSIIASGIPRATSPVAWVACCAVVAASFVFQTMGIRIPIVGAGWARLDADYWPVEATRAARTYMGEHPTPGRIFNDMLFGGYLIAELPQAKVYIDDRCELYGDDFLLHYVEILRSPQRIEQEVAARQIDLAMVKPDSRMAAYFATSPYWQPLHKNAAAALFARRLTTPQTTSHLPRKLLPG